MQQAPTQFFSGLDSGSVCVIQFSHRYLKKALLQSKSWIKPTSYKVKHNINNFEFMEKVKKTKTNMWYMFVLMLIFMQMTDKKHLASC